MEFEYTEEQIMFQRMIRDFATKELEPVAARIDEDEEYPAENLRKMAEIGLFGLGVAEEYGGSGGDSITLNIATEEIARVCASSATILLASVSLTYPPIYVYGSEEQKQRFIVPMARGEKLGCFALTESMAGSDAAAVETTATRDGDDYVLNGNKLFVSNGKEAEIAVVFATIDKSLRHRGITAFVVEKGSPGFSVGKKEKKLGIRGSSTTELVFEDCRVPAANRIGEEGRGFRIAIDAIDRSRISVAAQAVGIAQGALDACVRYAKERQQFGQPIGQFQAIQWMLADMATNIDAARLLTHRAAYLKDSGQPFVRESAMAKVFASEMAMWVTTKAIQIHGGYGFIKDYPLERFFRDAKITEIYEGTSEMQRLTIARQLLA